MRIAYKVFRAGAFTSWDTLLEGVAKFAGPLGPDRLVSISQSVDHSEAVVVVWYWEGAGKR